MKVIVGGQLETVTDKDGYYKFQNVSTGTYDVKVDSIIIKVANYYLIFRLKAVWLSLMQ